MRLRSRLAVAAAVLGVGAVGVGVAFAAFSSTTVNPASTFSAKRIFTGSHALVAHDVKDASGGAGEVAAADNLAVAGDALETRTASNLLSTYSSSRYVDVNLDAGRPTGLAVSGAQVRLSVASVGGGGSGNACYWFEVRRQSTGTLLGSHGSSASPVACSSGATQTVVATNVPEVATTDIADDARIRVYVWETGAKKVDFDLATLTGTDYAAFTSYDVSVGDASAGSTPVTTPWLLQAQEGTAVTTVGTWATTFSSSRYVKLSLSHFVPTGAVVSGTSLSFAYKSAQAGDTTCWYLEIYNGATLIGTHGSSGTPISCNATTSFVTDPVTLSEVDTPAEANNLTLKVFMKDSGAKKTLIDLARVTLTYYLD